MYANNNINDISLIGKLLYESNFLKKKDTPNPYTVPIKTLKNKIYTKSSEIHILFLFYK